ncbi:uroporphyrinogen-III C-methyltransferase [Candidatus Ichthyocystis hellenicum]|uniref:uroporphyrinogen-III C-methyltransferase n=1 Tax=Candidatus Ichthyocystis hellenicum TaxID=1561003 RepID=UPI000B84044A|nr:uroporphyrinogen-III C-methyltransferase [Candidatus Ichthyocystis hellenicum]
MADSSLDPVDNVQEPKKSILSFWVKSFFLLILVVGVFGIFFASNVLYEYVATNKHMIATLSNSDRFHASDLNNLSRRVHDIEDQLKSVRSSYERGAELLNHYSDVHNNQVLVQIRGYVGVATSNLMWLSHPDRAVSTLTSAYLLAKGVDDPAFSRLADLLKFKIDLLKKLPLYSSDDFYVQMMYFVDTLESLHFVGSPSSRLVNNSSTMIDEGDKNSFWKSVWVQFQRKFHDFVRIYHESDPNLALLTPEEKNFVREMIHLHTLSLKLAWVIHDQNAYNSSLGKITRFVDRYFDRDDNYNKFKDTIGKLYLIKFVSPEVVNMSDIEHCIDHIQAAQKNPVLVHVESSKEVSA